MNTCILKGRRSKVKQSTYLHDIKQALLAKSILLLEEVVVREGAGDVPPDQLLAGRGLLQVLHVQLFVGRVVHPQ